MLNSDSRLIAYRPRNVKLCTFVERRERERFSVLSNRRFATTSTQRLPFPAKSIVLVFLSPGNLNINSFQHRETRLNRDKNFDPFLHAESMLSSRLYRQFSRHLPPLVNLAILCAKLLLLVFNYFNANKSCFSFFPPLFFFFHRKPLRHRRNVCSAGQNQPAIFYYRKYHDLRLPPGEVINNISVGGQVGVFPQLLRLS